MKLVTFQLKNQDKKLIGTLEGDQIRPLTISAQDFYVSGSSSLDNLELVDNTVYSLGEVLLCPVVPAPEKILCVGLNYARHAEESGMALPSSPVMFSKFNNSLAANGENIPYNPKFTQVDYEAELVVVIGKVAKNVSEEEALDYVLGYCNGNDLSERALQLNLPGGQWLMGKTPDKFMPIGSYLVTADEIPDPQNLTIKGWLNGELRQDSHTSDMIFSVAQVIAYVSQFVTLVPGDIISTGTPEGVILGMSDKVWMQAGDRYVVEIEGLGKLENQFVEAS